MTLEGINTSYDFLYWEHDIQHCPCVPPVTEEEVDLYMRYLQSDNCNVEGTAFMHGWQDYEGYKVASQGEDGDIVPQWYVFFDTYMGTSALLNLPDLKSMKERLYRQTLAAHKMQQAKAAGNWQEPPPQGEQKPFLRYFDNKELMRFVSEFESEENQEMFLNYQHVHYQPTKDDQSIKEELENAIYLTLSKAKEHVPIEAHSDWMQAVIRAAKRYKQEKIAEAMPSVFEEYTFKIEAGIGYPALEKENTYEWVKQLGEEILEGRSLAGEPRDYEY
ncbi:MAG: hypothetical protein SH857_12925 [Chitinophagales bacterium]|nr:hypothetical protein [Chitinophagales bacterium]